MPEPNDKPVTAQPDPKPEKKEPELTGEQLLELERLRAQRTADTKTIEELRSHDRDRNVKDSYTKAIESTGLRSHLPEADLIRLLNKQDDTVISYSGDGKEIICEVKGKRVEFGAFLETFALANRTLFDQRTMRHLVDKGSDAIVAQDDLDREQRMQYISKHGLEKFESLPAHRPHTVDVSKMTFEDWKDLPLSERVRLTGELSELALTRIMQRRRK
jgi:hypothetical protein